MVLASQFERPKEERKAAKPKEEAKRKAAKGKKSGKVA
jgi:hypothetical protein